MSERYTRLFSLPENLGLEDCPVVISAGALLKDNITGNVLAQLKLRNLSHQAVKAVKVKIHAYDTAKTELNGVDSFSYLDLNVPLDGEFGSQTPIPLPDAATRSFTVDILSVTLADGSGYFTPHQTVDFPTEMQATKIVSGQILEKITTLDEERAAEAKKDEEAKKAKTARWKHLFRLSFVPLLLCVIAVTINYCYPNWFIKSLTRRIRITYREDKSVLFAFIIPCICILASWKSKRSSKVPMLAFAVCVVYIAVQTLSAIYYIYMRYGYFIVFTRYRGHLWIQMMQIMGWIASRIEGHSLIEWCQDLLDCLLEPPAKLRYVINSVLNVLFLILYFVKNIFAAVILYLQAKNAKNKRSTL